jgi:hypothetical protein
MSVPKPVETAELKTIIDSLRRSRAWVVIYFETLMAVKTIHEATRNVILCPFRVISWIVLAQGKTTRNQTRALRELNGVWTGMIV